MQKLTKDRIVLIIPYYGSMPPYFDLWKNSAEANHEITFLIVTDLKVPVKKSSNIKVLKMSFDTLKNRIANMLKMKIKLNAPYKLCDYKPAYGLLFYDEIKKFDFWGFCDMDLIFGNIASFIDDEILNRYDKISFHGHFCLMRNCEKMNTLFQNSYSRVLDFRHAFSTNYSCHFDENGTIAWPQNETQIRCYMEAKFVDPKWDSYELICCGNLSECCAIYENGKLTFVNLKKRKEQEIMYIHLQKRKMYGDKQIHGQKFAILRNEFINITEEISHDQIIDELSLKEVDEVKKEQFFKDVREKRKKQVITNLLTVAIRFRINRYRYSWKSR